MSEPGVRLALLLSLSLALVALAEAALFHLAAGAQPVLAALGAAS